MSIGFIHDLVEGELEYIGGFIGYIDSKILLYKPWLLMDDETSIPQPYHIRDMRAYGYLLERLERKKKTKKLTPF